MKWWSLGLHGLLRMFFLVWTWHWHYVVCMLVGYISSTFPSNSIIIEHNHCILCVVSFDLPLFWVVSFSMPYSSPDHMPNATCGVPPKQLQVRWVFVCFLHQKTQAYVRIGAGLDRRRRAHDYSDGDFFTPLTWWFHPSHLRHLRIIGKLSPSAQESSM